MVDKVRTSTKLNKKAGAGAGAPFARLLGCALHRDKVAAQGALRRGETRCCALHLPVRTRAPCAVAAPNSAPRRRGLDAAGLRRPRFYLPL